MISRIAFAGVIFLGCVSSGMAQQAAAPEPYRDADAYQIYSRLLPQEESYGDASGTLVIQEETVSKLREPGGFPSGPEDCVVPEVALRFQDAISDYNRINQKHWLLRRTFQLQKPYEIVSSDALKVLFHGRDWDGFYQRYPTSGGIFVLSAVGFNQQKTRAIVYAGASCGSLCGSWSFHLFEKADAGWQEVPGVVCHTVS